VLGYFITFEGIEGSGKTTHIARLRDRLEALGHTVLQVREPGGTPLGDRIREILLNGPEMVDEAEALLFAASRAQIVASVIAPALEEGTTVLCDRFVDSSVVYQGHARRLSVPAVLQANEMAVQGRWPDRTLLFDLPPELGLERAASRLLALDRIEREGLSFHRTCREGFLTEAREHPNRYRVIDAALSKDEVEEQVWKAVQDLF